MPAQKSKSSIPKPTTAKDFEELGRRLNNIYQMGYISRWEMMKMGFLKGIAAGFGGVIGATLVVALILWFLSLLDTVPFLGPIFDNLEKAIENN